MGAGKPSLAGLVYRFEPYEADIARGELRKFGSRIRLERKPWFLLVALLERPGELVTRAELQAALWPNGTFVDFEHGLNVAVKKLRAALCDSPDSVRYIETIAGEGYRFVAEVEQVLANPSLPNSLSEPIIAGASPDVMDGRTVETENVSEPTGVESFALGATQSWVRGRKAPLAVAAALCLALLSIAVAKPGWRRLRPAEVAHHGKVMLVVLPFENLSGDSSQEYLSDGMTEELSARLGNLDPQRLGVIGRTSAMTYKNSHAAISRIGKDLAVDYVLEGSVRRDRNEVRVTAQLVQVSDQTHVWAENYDRDIGDLLRLEGDISGDIAREVGVSIALAQTTRPAVHIPNPEAHEAYLLGRYNWNKRTPAGWRTAEQYFRRAIQIEPQYAAAYAGLAECRIPAREAEAAALKAVELDPKSGEARTALAWVELYKDRDLAAAERAFKSAVQLDPNYAPARHSYSEYLAMIGQLQESIAEKRQAVLLDPLSPLYRSALAEALTLAGQDDSAAQEIRRVFEIEPNFPKGHEASGEINVMKGRYKEAIREFQASEQHGGDKPLGLLGYAYARSGDKKNALRIMAELQEEQKRSGGATYELALVQLGLGHNDEALGWLEKGYEDRDEDGLLLIKQYPIFDALRSDPRFEALLRRMNFPQ